MLKEEKSIPPGKQMSSTANLGSRFPGQQEEPVKLARPPAPSYPATSQERALEWREGENFLALCPEMCDCVPPLGGWLQRLQEGAFSPSSLQDCSVQPRRELSSTHLDLAHWKCQITEFLKKEKRKKERKPQALVWSHQVTVSPRNLFTAKLSEQELERDGLAYFKLCSVFSKHWFLRRLQIKLPGGYIRAALDRQATIKVRPEHPGELLKPSP